MNKHVAAIIDNYISLKLPFEKELLKSTRHLIVHERWSRGNVTRIIYACKKWCIGAKRVWPDNWSKMDKKRLSVRDFSKKIMTSLE